MTEDELVEKVAQGVFDSYHAGLKNCHQWNSSDLDDEHPEAREYYLNSARAAIAVARPIIEREALEKAAKVVDIAYHQEPFGDDATITIADDPTKIAAAIRALMEQSK